MPYLANSSSSGADLVKKVSRVCRKLPQAELVGVGQWCQPAGQHHPSQDMASLS